MSDPTDHPILRVYDLLAFLGIDPSKIISNYSEIAGADPLFFGIPSTKVGFAPDGAQIQPYLKDGWSITQIPDDTLVKFAQGFSEIRTMAFQSIRRESQQNQVKTGSKEEELLMAAILKANLPVPDRNYSVKRDNGKELTVPDFAWPDLKIAFYMDGLWWHKTKDDKRLMSAIAEAAEDPRQQNEFLNGERTRAQRDGDNRSELSSQGWVILTCTDTDLATPGGVTKQVDRISKTMRNVKSAAQKAASAIPTTNGMDDEELFDLI